VAAPPISVLDTVSTVLPLIIFEKLNNCSEILEKISFQKIILGARKNLVYNFAHAQYFSVMASRKQSCLRDYGFSTTSETQVPRPVRYSASLEHQLAETICRSVVDELVLQAIACAGGSENDKEAPRRLGRPRKRAPIAMTASNVLPAATSGVAGGNTEAPQETAEHAPKKKNYLSGRTTEKPWHWLLLINLGRADDPQQCVSYS
jgi:hypothetical protein